MYQFMVGLLADPTKTTRTLALRAEHTLVDLHLAIQEAFEWDADHLYSFYMNGRRYDQHYEIPCASLDSRGLQIVPLNFDDLEADEPDQPDAIDDSIGTMLPEPWFGEDESAEDDEGVFTASQAIIGELGLLPKDTFLYYFDFGDSHQFEVKVVSIEPHTDGGNYPRLVASVGTAPAQYFWVDEEDDYEEDEYEE